MQSLYRVSAGDLQRFLDAPELLGESEEMQMAIASFPETPRSLLQLLVNSDYSTVAEASCLHVNWLGEVTEDYREAVSEVLRDRDLGENDSLAVELMRFAPVPPDLLSEWVPVNKLIQGLKNEYMPLRYRLQLLERLSREGELEARLQVAESSETPVSLLELLAGDLNLAVRLAVEFNDNCPSEVVELVKSQYLKASDWDTDLGELEVLGESNWGWVRLAVAENPFAPEDVLMKLAGDEEFRIRLAVAKNPGVTANVLNVLMEDGDSGIQSAIAEHPNATEEILLELFSTHKDVIKKKDNLPASILERFFREATANTLVGEHEYLYLLLKQSNTPAWILAEFANVDLKALKNKILAYYDFPISSELSEELFEDGISFLVYIAEHPQVSAEILQTLSVYPIAKVKLAVAQNNKTDENLKQELLEELAVHPKENIRLELAKDVNTPVHILEKIGRFEFYQTKLLREIRKVLASESTVDGHSFKSNGDFVMSQLKHNILSPAGISIDVESWMKIIETAEILQVLESKSGLNSIKAELFSIMNNLRPQWIKILPNLSNDSIREFIEQFRDVLDLINWEVKSCGRSVALAIVGNPKTPVNLRKYLTNQLFRPSLPLRYQGSDCDVLLALAYNPQISEIEQIKHFQKVIEENPNNYATRIARDARTPSKVLEKMLERGIGKKEIAKNPATPQYILRKMADETGTYWWEVLAENPNTPIDLLFRFLKGKLDKRFHSGESIVDLVISNPGFPFLERYRLLLEKKNCEYVAEVNEFMARRSKNIREQLSNSVLLPEKQQQSITLSELPRIYDSNNDDLTIVLTEYAESDNQFVRFVVLLHPVTPEEILTQGANSAFWLERYAVAENEGTPLELLETLAGNGNWIVRAAANYSISTK